MSDDEQTENEQQHQSYDHNDTCNTQQSIVGVEDIALRTDGGHAPSCILKGLVEHVAGHTVDVHDTVTCLTCYHRLTDAGGNRVVALHRTGENGFVEQLGTVRMHQIGTALTQQNAVGMRIGLGLADGGREPVEADIDREGSHDLPLCVMNGLTIAGEYVPNDDALFSVLEERFYPVGFVKQFGNQIPVHTMVLIVVRSFLFGLDRITVVVGIGREIATFLLEEIGFERDAATCQFRIALQYLTAQVEHEVGIVKMTLDDHQHVVGCYLGAVQGIVDVEHSTLNGLRGLVPSLLAHHITRLGKHQGEGGGKDGRHENHHPEAQPSG